MVAEKAINKVIKTGLENGGGRLFNMGANRRLVFSAGVFFGCANVFARESSVLKLHMRGGSGASQMDLSFLPEVKSLNDHDRDQVL